MFGNAKKSPFYDIGRSPEATTYLATELDRLMALPLTTPAEVEHWYEEAGAVGAALKHRFPHFEPDHEVSHFLCDADIRSRDSGYCERQHKFMSEYVQDLRKHPGID